eukprot:3125965-Rhodomonas_salina.2
MVLAEGSAGLLRASTEEGGREEEMGAGARETEGAGAGDRGEERREERERGGEEAGREEEREGGEGGGGEGEGEEAGMEGGGAMESSDEDADAGTSLCYLLWACYAMPGTDGAYAATRRLGGGW